MNQSAEEARAFAFAAYHHWGQMYGDVPYIDHLRDVRDIVYARFPTTDALQAAWLHDVVEDTTATIEDIQERFGPVVTAIVDFCTDVDGHNRKERKARTAEKQRGLIATCVWADRGQIVKAADRLANIRNCKEQGNARLLRMYAKEHAGFSSHIRNERNAPMFDEMAALLSTNESAGGLS